MNRWDQEMLRGQIAPEQLGYPGLMPDRQFSYGGNDISLGDIRPEDNLLMRMQEVPSMRDQYQQFMKTPSPSMIGMFLEALNDPSQLPQSMQPYGAGVRDSIRGSFGGAGGMGLDIARNLFAPTTPEENSMGLGMGATGRVGGAIREGASKIGGAINNMRNAPAVGKVKQAYSATNTDVPVRQNILDDILAQAQDVWNYHNPQTQGGGREMNLPIEYFGPMKDRLTDLYKRFKTDFDTQSAKYAEHKKLTKEFLPIPEGNMPTSRLQGIIDAMKSGEKGDLEWFFPKNETTIYDNAKGVGGKNAWNAIGEALGEGYEAIGGDRIVSTIKNLLGDEFKGLAQGGLQKAAKYLPEATRGVTREMAQGLATPEYKKGIIQNIVKEQGELGKVPSIKKMQDIADNKYWDLKGDADRKGSIANLRELGDTGKGIAQDVYRDILPASGGKFGTIKDAAANAIEKNLPGPVQFAKYYMDKKGLKDIDSSAAKYLGLPTVAGSILSNLPAPERNRVVDQGDSVSKRMIDALFGKGVDLSEIVDVPMSWKDGGGYIGKYEYNPRAANIRTNNMRDLSDQERLLLEKRARKYAEDWAKSANEGGASPRSRVTMLPSYINYLRDLL